ncbi:MAG: hypothetical protein LBP73_01855 [Clostridiales Family XIII bacterium]|jgi:hypothetical protein|nr:hypothetical protein [Clostridiales Family XIII bacterium]
MAVTEPIRSKHQVRELSNYYFKRGQFRNCCLIVLGVHTALRVSDLLRLTWEDVYDFVHFFAVYIILFLASFARDFFT